MNLRLENLQFTIHFTSDYRIQFYCAELYGIWLEFPLVCNKHKRVEPHFYFNICVYFSAYRSSFIKSKKFRCKEYSIRQSCKVLRVQYCTDFILTIPSAFRIHTRFFTTSHKRNLSVSHKTNICTLRVLSLLTNIIYLYVAR